MNIIEHLLKQLQDTNSAAARIAALRQEDPSDDLNRVNTDAILKRRNDLERRLSTELRYTQSDLVQYHVEREDSDRYPALAVAGAIAKFQELVTAVFDALRTTPKQRYRPSPESIELSTLDFAMALPIGSVVVSMSIANERLIAIQSDIDETFDRVFKLLDTNTSDGLREIASEVGIAAISKAHDWAASAAHYGLNTKVAIQKDGDKRIQFSMSNVEALRLKEAIEEKSDKNVEPEIVVGELFGIDVDRSNTYFHIKTVDGRNIEGKLGDTFPTSQEWAVHVQYKANVVRVTTIRYATGEEKIDWLLASLSTDI